MIPDEVLERIFADANIRNIPIGCQSEMVSVMERVFREMGVEIIVSKSEPI